MLKTSKFHIENYTIAPIIRLLWEPFSGKRAHFWNWSHTDKVFKNEILVKGDKTLHPLNNLWHTLIELNFRWNELIILEPEEYKGEYQLAYKNSHKQELCSIIVKNQIACLRDYNDTQYTAFSYPDGNEIQLKIVKHINKKDLPKEILFL